MYFFPRRYEDRSQFCAVSDLRPGDTVTVRGEIISVKSRPFKRMSILEVTIGDETGWVHAVWFNQPYLKDQFAAGREIIIYGKVDFYQKRLQFNSPEYELVVSQTETVHTSRITPIYPLTEGLFQRSLRTVLKDVVGRQSETVIREYLPEQFVERKKLMSRAAAIHEMHFPTTFEKLGEARRRIVFDEFLLFEITLLKKLEELRTRYRAVELKEWKAVASKLRETLPFELTPSQTRAFEEIAEDLQKPAPMNRLLMGDVGSGKTVVEAFALLTAAASGHQAALLVPTEILARQHYRTLSGLFKHFSVSVKLLTSNTGDDARNRMLAELKSGKLDVLVGTHALLNEDVTFKSLALVVVDEQHKFGVYQRCRLLEGDPRPHQLVATATPIPRTLALTLYGDLSTSSLTHLPKGRKPIKTYWITRKKQGEVLDHILEKIHAGEQAYFIFPLIEDTEQSDLFAAKTEYDRLQRTVFSGVHMGLVHGRLSADERDQVMRAFRAGEIQALVATSVVEVGVDNPNATMMVIENAERFGLSQLHQMRGRIGRGAKASECFLFGEPTTDEGKMRLRILTKTQDGFLIAEEDLKLRGPGDFWGARQSGDPLFLVAHPVLDEGILLEARESAMELVQGGLLETSDEWNTLKKYLEEFPLRY